MTNFNDNFERAMELPMPARTFAKLNAAGDFVSLTVRPGLINKHVTAEQLQVLAQLADEAAVKYSAGHSFIVSVEQQKLEAVVAKLTAVGLYAIQPGARAVVKCYDFCDGDRLEALSFARELLQQIEQLPMKKRLRIGFNACTEACYNAVRDDIGLVYHNGYIDLYAGAVQMGRRASSGTLWKRKIPEHELLPLLQNILSDFEQSDCKTFAAFVKRGE